MVCTAPDTCHDPGTCYPWAGCVNPPVKPNGAACNDGQACTQGEACNAGSCQPPAVQTPVVLNLPVDSLGSFGAQSFATGINASGTAVGYSQAADGFHGWQWRLPARW